MHIPLSLLPILGSLAQASPILPRASSWPNAPFTASGRDIKNSLNETVVYAGVNWPGAADVMIPEGLQYQSVSSIMSKIKDLGMNVIRLTYAIELVDDIYSGVDSSLKAAFIQALGETNGTKVLNQVLSSNPSFTENTTRLEVFDAIAAEADTQLIYVHLDNHVSKGEWCCGHDDGNAWFGDTYFNVANWKRGLAYMSSHAKSWPAFTSMSLRNELRTTSNGTGDNWVSWYENMVPAADGINAANPAPLIFFSGLNYDTQLATIVNGKDIGNGTTFSLDNYSYKDKIVWELHNYANSATNCNDIKGSLRNQGYNAMEGSASAVNKAPVVLTEFGFDQNTGSSSVYAQCIKEYLTTLPGGPGGWMQWVISGSYYIREGAQDKDETWGLLNHDWSDWRNQTASDYTKSFVEKTLV
ncbi:glycoside hydrolase family 5 protein [Aureobasidium subglaciale EXF-2481]|uniref:Glycoside hydrolase family 5 protein n=1 Tax=Aureobasidium subglaciale (strain EXF-2481) TaxID=1043005 RepID=A0A074YMI4_AURSE|nr:glycoside hydrolase family 5 protein [Aureobasidium subglaciale EXF-2481]KAI5205944.1 putative endoglucanase E1 [Aureobasidium subglaciale]KAI5224880.1 putative endoglucanase E1 [Aureobasidium subglaciale]KAI5227894.1 putative endoglucanase E1 [Aureobasidium subglaciale]KAI5263554.1 putative endoglucanase E1 [Aureobasidium subglaciale]KEQ97289.1 glycoside hydrolase family 5 protein [Aureobasidium subglaciale EXF-2481]